MSGVCECGGANQPCCSGTTCDDGLSCGATSTCAANGFVEVAVGTGHVCALREDKAVWCWGFDYKPFGGALPGINTSVIANPEPAPVAGLTDVAAIRAADFHTCARKTDNTLWCWGHNEAGQLGNGTSTNSATAVRVSDLTNVSLFDGGRLHACALGSYMGTPGLYCWGRNGEKGRNGSPANPNLGRLGNNTVVDSNLPVAVDLSAAAAAGQTVRSLSTGAYHTCIAMSDNRVWCWGRNNLGQLGTGTTTDSKVPVQVSLAGITIPSGATIDEVSCSGSRRKQDSSCLRLSTGAIHCWGYNGEGELGDGGTANRNAPTLAVVTTAFGGAKPLQIASGQNARCTRTSDGFVYCWGRDHAGVLGLDLAGAARYPIPSRTRVIGDVTYLDVGHHTACAVDQSRRLFCWGTNTRGQSTTKAANTFEEKSVLKPFQIVF
jgi:alpha-tubulin suppressor-like RCC1 family protein